LRRAGFNAVMKSGDAELAKGKSPEAMELYTAARRLASVGDLPQVSMKSATMPVDALPLAAST
jgi:hypothetical protein